MPILTEQEYVITELSEQMNCSSNERFALGTKYISQGITKVKAILPSIVFFCVCSQLVSSSRHKLIGALALKGKINFKLEIPLLTPLSNFQTTRLFGQSVSSDASLHL